MNNEFVRNGMSNGIALNKIPEVSSEQEQEILTEDGIDKIKIIELTTAIDNWEKEILFSENGFYSLKGRAVENKINRYIGELERFISHKTSKMTFTQSSSYDIVYEIKQQKIQAIEAKMQAYTQEELHNWEMETYENALKTSIDRAVLYKNDDETVAKSMQNGINILKTIAQKDDWSPKLFNYRKKQFVSDFYLTLINAFIKEKEIKAYQYFNKAKDLIESDDKENLEKQVEKMRVDIIASNWAKEIFSYNYEENEYEKALNEIKDEDIRNAAKEFYSDLKKSEKRKKMLEETEKNKANWKEIIEIAEKDINQACLYIDFSMKQQSSKRKKEYIKQMREAGAVKTDAKEFVRLTEEAFSDFQAFREKDISDYRGCLSKEDFEIFEKIQQYSVQEFIYTDFDRKYLLKAFKTKGVKSDEEKYDFIRVYFCELESYKAKNLAGADLEARKKLTNTIFTHLETMK